MVVLQGEYQGREIPLPETIFLIGRDEGCHLRPHCPRVSRKHCAIATWAGKVRIRDLQSRNGTFVNGERVQGEMVVSDGDELQVGSHVFAFQIRAAGQAITAEPIRDEREVDWLLQADEDQEVLAPARGTNEVPLEVDLTTGLDGPRVLPGCETHTFDASKTAAQKSAPAKAGVSAGRHLRQYFAQRKQSP
jgi:pSer/pThr/pTyr-binding forkhead associated (FHA) protein